MNQENKPDKWDKLNADFDKVMDNITDEEFDNWYNKLQEKRKASKPSYTEQKQSIKSPEEILTSHRGSNGISLFDRLEYDHSHNSVLNCMHEYAKQFYTQEQILAFGEAVKQRCIKADRWSDIFNIDISELLNK